MAIRVTVNDLDDKEIATIWMREAPRVGEHLWFTGADQRRTTEDYGTSSFTVKEVAHWVCADWAPSHREPTHTICVYAEPTKKEP